MLCTTRWICWSTQRSWRNEGRRGCTKVRRGCWPWVVGGGGVFDSIDDLLFFSFFFVLVLVVFFFHVILGKEKVLKGVFKKYVNSVSSAHTGAVTY